MKITKTIEIEIPMLGSEIKKARLADDRSLKEICCQLNMSVMNWYRIEKEQQSLPIETLRAIEGILKIDFKVEI